MGCKLIRKDDELGLLSRGTQREMQGCAVRFDVQKDLNSYLDPNALEPRKFAKVVLVTRAI